tara:strand:+ start:158 stop:1066 length:909 start_codon:yes stop_codon:yes gene_type:complete
MQTDFQKLLTLDLSRKDAIPSLSKQRLEEEVWQGRLDYLNAPNANARNSIKQSLIKKASYIVDVESMKTNIATTILDEEEFGKNPEEKLGESFVQNYGAIMTGEKSYDVLNGQPGYYMPSPDGGEDVFVHLHELEDYVDSKKIDLDSKDTLNTLITNASMDGANLKPGQSTNFNYTKYKSNIMNNIIPNANMDSLINDEIFGGRVFKNDLVEAIMTSTYDDLGITLSEEEIKALDPTDDGKISFSDAMVIFAELMSNEERAKNYVADYYTKFMEQNFNNSISEETIQGQNKKESGYNPYEFA